MLIDCPKCQGTGSTHFGHIANGVCFQCNGSKKVQYSASLNLLLDDFIVKGFPKITDGQKCTIKAPSLTMLAGGEFVAKKVNKLVIIWDKNKEADWHFAIPAVCIDIFEKHFARL